MQAMAVCLYMFVVALLTILGPCYCATIMYEPAKLTLSELVGDSVALHNNELLLESLQTTDKITLKLTSDYLQLEPQDIELTLNEVDSKSTTLILLKGNFSLTVSVADIASVPIGDLYVHIACALPVDVCEGASYDGVLVHDDRRE